MKKLILIGMCISLLLMVGCTENSPFLRGIDCFEVPAEHEWEVVEVVNHPDNFNCSALAYIIENDIYPSEIRTIYQNYTLFCSDGYNQTSWVEGSISGDGIKEKYTQYFFKECLTKLFEVQG